MASKNIPPNIISALQLASDIRTEVKSQNELLDNMVRLSLDHCVTEPVDMNSINTGTFLESVSLVVASYVYVVLI